MLVHRLPEETGARIVQLPFVPYRLPPTGDPISQHAAARRSSALDKSVINVATFGIVDRRTKGADVLVEVLTWLSLWKIPARLHYVGHAPSSERKILKDLAIAKGVSEMLAFYDHLSEDKYCEMLLAVAWRSSSARPIY